MKTNAEIYCAVRFDDVCPTMNWKQFEKAIALMKEYHIKPLLGVIPDNRDIDQVFGDENPLFWEIISDLQKSGYIIAMHGYHHVYDSQKRGMVNRGVNSEYAGHSYETQFYKIKKGKELLEAHGIDTDIFFAPAHSYDKNTLKALKANGFRYLSDGKSFKPYIQCGIKCIPCRFFGTPKVRNLSGGIFIAVCHANKWDTVPENYDKLVNFCERNKNYLTDYSQLLTMDAASLFSQKISEKLYIIFHDIIRARFAGSKTLSAFYHHITR